MKHRLYWVCGAAAAVALTACSSGSALLKPASATSQSASSTVTQLPSSAGSPTSSAATSSAANAAATSTGRTAAAWQRMIDAAALTTADLTSGFRSTKPVEPNGQTECPSLDAVSASRTHDLAYRRVSFELSANGPFLDEVIAVNADAGGVLDEFATTPTACARFQSTASDGDVIHYQATAQSVQALGDRSLAVWVDGRVKNATGAYEAGEGVLLFQKGPVVVQISSAGVPPPLPELSPTVAALAYRKLVQKWTTR